MSKKKKLHAVRGAYVSGDWSSYAASVAELARLYPRDYGAMLARERLLPSEVTEEINLVVDLQASRADVPDVSRMFNALALIDRRVAAIRARTDRSSVWQNPVALVFRFAALIDEQAHLLEQIAFTSGHPAFPQALLADDIPLSDGGSASMTSIHEHTVEAFQVVLAHAEATHRLRLQDMPKSLAVVDDERLMEVVALAQLWRGFEDLRQEVIFLGWRAEVDPDGTWRFGPRDATENRLMAIGMRRRIEQLTVAAMYATKRFEPRTDHKNAAAAVVASLHPPAALEMWDGVVDRTALRHMARTDPTAAANDGNVIAFFYQPIADALVIGDDDVPWRVVNQVAHVLRALADAFTQKFSGTAANPRLVLVDREVLATVLSEASGVTRARTVQALRALTFDPTARELEMWDAPLVQASGSALVLVPQVVLTGMSLRRLENFASMRDRNLFDQRGEALESFVADVFRRERLPVQSPVRFGSTKTECDVVVWWNDWLILFEAKCTKSIFSAYDAFRGREAIDNAVQQLLIRRDAILSNWTAFRTAARDLPLPDAPLSRDRVALVAVANIPHFTSLRVGDVVVTDDWCLQRFFSDPAITLENASDAVSVLGYVRPPGPTTPEMLLDYLAAPGQVRFADAGLREVVRWLPSVDAQPPVAVSRMTYNPPLVKDALQRLDASSINR